MTDPTEKKLADKNAALDLKIEEDQAKISNLLGFADLITLFCVSCLTSAWHGTHEKEVTSEGRFFRPFGCGRRGPKMENLR